MLIAFIIFLGVAAFSNIATLFLLQLVGDGDKIKTGLRSKFLKASFVSIVHYSTV